MSETGGVEERRDDGDTVQYMYEIHGSGTLIVWANQHGGMPEIEVAYGPGAWIKVSGKVARR
ncbi:hypothetical protein HUT18_32365 [Streptomyces sp. NA04227]|uniref:hypothetical protein n=1 Tax=Streptomyces sp. NA04227 TaxID=2742136 RepID=UPI0015916EF6|nr:hypothetical protein [Streptomyces sp. NA04227]QKW10411.1 hypothetical protein HUT18_32365 [Streptomyces sp. NA04227]